MESATAKGENESEAAIASALVPIDSLRGVGAASSSPERDPLAMVP